MGSVVVFSARHVASLGDLTVCRSYGTYVCMYGWMDQWMDGWKGGVGRLEGAG